jgi:hypothetical protein
VPPAAEAMVSLIQTTIGTVLAPLMAEQAALRQTVERQAEQLVSQAGTIGSLTQEVATLKASQALPAWRSAPWWLWTVLGALSVAVIVLVAGAAVWLVVRGVG